MGVEKGSHSRRGCLWWCFSADGEREGDMEVTAVGNQGNIIDDSSSLTGEGDERDDSR